MSKKVEMALSVRLDELQERIDTLEKLVRGHEEKLLPWAVHLLDTRPWLRKDREDALEWATKIGGSAQEILDNAELGVKYLRDGDGNE